MLIIHREWFFGCPQGFSPDGNDAFMEPDEYYRYYRVTFPSLFWIGRYHATCDHMVWLSSRSLICGLFLLSDSKRTMKWITQQHVFMAITMHLEREVICKYIHTKNVKKFTFFTYPVDGYGQIGKRGGVTWIRHNLDDGDGKIIAPLHNFLSVLWLNWNWWPP